MAMQAFPDSTLEITNIIANETFVATQCDFRGTHAGTMVMPQGQIEATGKKVLVHAAGFFPIMDGKIFEYRRRSDAGSFIHQLGIDMVGAQ